jgi:multidrug efflux pump subunit AcrB
MNITRFSLRNRLIVWMLVVIMMAWGIYTYNTISRREDPEIKISFALVVTIWPGKGAEDIERLVTSKLEDEIEKMGTLKVMTSTTRENVSLIMVNINFNTDDKMEWQRLRNRLDEARGNLPDGIIGPDVMDDLGDVTSMIYSLRSETATPKELEDWAEKLKADIKKIESVSKVNLLGVQEEVIYIEGPMESFSLYNFSPLMASKILDFTNVNIPAGYVRFHERDMRLDTSGAFKAVEQIENAVIDVSRQTGAPLKVKDVFSVRRAYREPPNSKMLTMGIPSVGLDIRMKDGNNVVVMGEEVKKVVSAFKTSLPDNITLELLHDQPREVNEFIRLFMKNLLEGLIIVILVTLTLMGIRTTMIIAVSLPLCIFATMALMPMFNIDLEMGSIAAFIIALGMLVDDSIIIIDNIHRHMERGEPPVQAAINGTRELMIPALTGGTLATVFAFMPLLLLKDEIGAYIRSLPIIVSVSMLFSYIIAITVTPILATTFMKVKPVDFEARQNSSARKFYNKLLRSGMKIRYLVLAAAVAALVGAIMMIPIVGVSFFPEWDRDQFTIDVRLPEGAGVEKTEEIVREVEKRLAVEPDISNWATYIGEGGPRFQIAVMPEFNMPNYARFIVNTKDKNKTRVLVERMRNELRETIVGARVSPSNLQLAIPVEAAIAIKIEGPDIDAMRTISQEVQDILKATPGTDMIRDDLGQEIQSLAVSVDSEAAAMAGISNTEVALAMLTAQEGLPVTNVRSEDKKIPVVLRSDEAARHENRTLSELRVTSMTTGAKVPLSAIAEIKPAWAPGVVHRRDNRRVVTVLAEANGVLASSVMSQAWPKIQQIRMPSGYTITSEGEEKERNKAFGELIVIFVLIIMALLFMVTIQFKSLKKAFVILSAVPMAIIGAVLGLYFSGQSLGFMPFLGIVSLAGIVIKNAVIWVDFVERSLADGNKLSDSIIMAGIARFRPIVLTAGTATGGLIPLAIFGGALWMGMACAMIGGLIVSTILTLFIIPVIYYTIFRKSYRADGTACNTPEKLTATEPT